MNYKPVFEALRDLVKLRRQEVIESKYTSEYDEYGERYEVYKVGEQYVKLYTYEDSYGDDKGITGIEIVEPKKVQVTNFEPINL